MKVFDFECDAGHKVEEFFYESEELPDEIPCRECEKVGEKNVKMKRVLMYPTAGYLLPGGTGTY